jgi:hypothetical protein
MLSIFSPRKTPQKTSSFKSFFGNNFLNKSKKEDFIETKNSLKKKKRKSKSNILNKKKL